MSDSCQNMNYCYAVFGGVIKSIHSIQHKKRMPALMRYSGNDQY